MRLARGGLVAISLTVAAAMPALHATADAATAQTLSNPTCAVPALPHGVAKGSEQGSWLSGPAVTALTGGSARHGFALDGGGLVVRPPMRSEVPLLTEDQAVCGAMASTAGLTATATQGVAVGYGRVSVAAKFFPAITGFPSPGQPASKYPVVRSFTDRLAWMVVVHTYLPSFSCPNERAPVRLVPRPSDHGYKVFMIDARNGADALVYTEGGPGGCRSGAREAPTVGVAEESYSVPWTLVSRDPGGYSGTIEATVLPCDQYPGTVLVDRSDPGVEVEVTRPYGPACSPPVTVPISLHAAVVTADLPAVIDHDPVGQLNNLAALAALLAPPAAPPSTTTTTSPTPLVPVDSSMNGQTIDVSVGEVVTMQPLPGAEGLSFTSPAVSTDPAILGPLTSSPQPLVAEFRAWEPGLADITVPQSACIHPGSDQTPCTGPFVVHVVVR
ncbi:MAG TPA: hypothetical protein VMF35_06450 [Acidimicrobiales bacterium]|nr:hypothetical protein [Acidimicrobiales bacterium]